MKRQKVLIAVSLILIAAIAGCFFYLLEQDAKRRKQEAYAAEVAALNERIRQETDYMAQMQHRYLETQAALLAERNDHAYREEIIQPSSLCLTAVGDSVMLGAVPLLRETFPFGTINARQNRSHYELYSIISDMASDGTLGNPVVIGIGTNGPLPEDLCRRIVDQCGDRQIFWLTTTNNAQFFNTDTIQTIGSEFDNVTVLDWDAFSASNPDFFYSDGIHLTPQGQEAYTEFIRYGITERLFELLPEVPNEQIFFIGDGHLLSCVSQMEELLSGNLISAKEPFDPEAVLAEISALKEMGVLPGKAVIVLSDSAEVDSEQLNALQDALAGCPQLLVMIHDISTDQEEPPQPSMISYADDRSLHPDHYAVIPAFFSETGAAGFTAFLKNYSAQENNSVFTALFHR
ncbi:MAG: hypothetical protein IKS32_02645 [Solobacterium sp.]|nr:hypothetical protein [Solobacterium sp.]